MASSAPERPEPNERPVFYFDFSSPECWLAAERVNHELATAPVWVPVRVRSASPASLSDAERADLERRAFAQGLAAPRLPDSRPLYSDIALRAATFAAASGRVVAFSLAALRQAFLAGRDLSHVDNVVIAAAACELHPRAVLKGIESRLVQQKLVAATEGARARTVSEVPAIVARGNVFVGRLAVDQAVGALEAI